VLPAGELVFLILLMLEIMAIQTPSESTVSTPELQTQYFKRSEGTLAYSDYGGTDDLVLMLPGMGALRSEYRFLAPKLRDAGYRAITMDLRGQGDSSVPWPTYDVPSVGGDILALIEHLNAGENCVSCARFSGASLTEYTARETKQCESILSRPERS
jgi:pimeloyl-ACP methyl ester carboxylesterase